MKTLIQYMKDFKVVLEDNCNCEVIDINMSLLDHDMFCTEVTFCYTYPNRNTELLVCISNIDMVYLDQFSDEHLVKQILGDVLFELESKLKEISTVH